MAQGQSTRHLDALLQRLNAGSQDRRSRRTQATALDLEDGWLHLAQAQLRGNSAQWTRHAATAIPRVEPGASLDPTVLGESLAKAFKSLRPDSTQVVMGIPRSQAIVRILSLPPASQPSEIAAMVHFQISRDLPFRMEDALLDFQVLPPQDVPLLASKGPSSTTNAGRPSAPDATAAETAAPTRVLAAVVRRATVDFHVALAKAAGLKLQYLGLRSLGTGRAAMRCIPDSADCVGFVVLGRGEITFDVWLNGTLVFSRAGSLPLPSEPDEPSEDPKPNPHLAEAALQEIVRSLHNYEGTPGHGRIDRFLVTGTTGLESEISSSLAARSKLPAHSLDPASTLDELPGNQDHPHGALAALGLALVALDPPGDSFDFLNPKRPPAPVDNRRVRRLAGVAGVLAVLLSVVAIRTRLVRQREGIRNDLQQEISLASKNLAGYRTIRTQAKTLNDWSAASRNWLDHLALLSSLLPPSRDLYVTSLSTSPRNTLSLSARIRSGEIVDRLTTDLKAAGYTVKPPGITPVNDKFGYRFQVSLDIDIPRTITNNLDQLTVEERASGFRREPAPNPTPTPAPGAQASSSPPAPDPNRAAVERSPAGPPAGASPPEDRPARRNRRRAEGGSRE